MQDMILPKEGLIDVARLSRVYDNTTATYKFYWFVSIIDWICLNPGRRCFSFDEIIAGMVAEAWYPIHYFRLSFGKLDSLETIVQEIQQQLDLPIDADRESVKCQILGNLDKPEIRKQLHILALNVPYRFLSPWIPKATDAQVVELSHVYTNGCPYAIID